MKTHVAPAPVDDRSTRQVQVAADTDARQGLGMSEAMAPDVLEVAGSGCVEVLESAPTEAAPRVRGGGRGLTRESPAPGPSR